MHVSCTVSSHHKHYLYFSFPKRLTIGNKTPSKNRWEDGIKSDITNMKITNCRDCIRNWSKWKEFLEKARTSLKL